MTVKIGKLYEVPWTSNYNHLVQLLPPPGRSLINVSQGDVVVILSVEPVGSGVLGSYSVPYHDLTLVEVLTADGEVGWTAVSNSQLEYWQRVTKRKR